MFSKNIKFTGSIVSTASIVKNNVCEYSKVEINKADLSNDSGNDVLYIGYAGNIPHAIGGTNTPKYYKVFSVTSKGKIDICAPTYNDASITVTHDSNIAGAQTIFSECYSKITPYGIDSVASYKGQSTIYNSGYNASGFAIRTEISGAYKKLIEAYVDDDNLKLKLTDNVKSKSIELDGSTGICTAYDFKTSDGISLRTLNSNLSNYQLKNWNIITHSENGKMVSFSTQLYSEFRFVCSKNQNVCEITVPTSLVNNNNNMILWVGSMVSSLGLVFKINITPTSFTPEYCFLNNQVTDIVGSVVYLYAR